MDPLPLLSESVSLQKMPCGDFFRMGMILCCELNICSARMSLLMIYYALNRRRRLVIGQDSWLKLRQNAKAR